MSGKDACIAIYRERENAKSKKEMQELIEDISTLGISSLLRKKPEKPVYEPAYNFIKGNIDIIQKKLIDNRCENASVVKQLNEIIQPVSCYKDIQARCTDNKGVINRECIDLSYKIVDEISNKRMEQININNLVSTCEINTVIDALSKKVKSEEDLLTLLLLQEAKEKISNKKPGVFSCNNIEQNVSKDTYIHSLLECANKSAVNQLNSAVGCNPAVSYQINENNEIKKCLLNSGVLTETEEREQNKTFTFPPYNFNSITTPITSINTTTPTTSTSTDNNNDSIMKVIIIGGIVLMVLILLSLLIFL